MRVIYARNCDCHPRKRLADSASPEYHKTEAEAMSAWDRARGLADASRMAGLDQDLYYAIHGPDGHILNVSED